MKEIIEVGAVWEVIKHLCDYSQVGTHVVIVKVCYCDNTVVDDHDGVWGINLFLEYHKLIRKANIMKRGDILIDKRDNNYAEVLSVMEGLVAYSGWNDTPEEAGKSGIVNWDKQTYLESLGIVVLKPEEEEVRKAIQLLKDKGKIKDGKILEA